MNCMEFRFTKVELEHWMATFEEKVWTNDILIKLSKAGLVRTTAAQVWNKENQQNRLGFLNMKTKKLIKIVRK